MTPRANGVLGAVALVLGGAAAVVGGPSAPAAGLDRPLPDLIAADRVTALEVAAWLRARRPDLAILDVRPAGAPFDAFHLPRARHVPVTTLRDSAGQPDGLTVVYGDGGDAAARAWVVLRTLGYDSVRVLPDGVGEWLRDVLNPTLGADASAAERAAFATQADLSRYFGGLPRVLRDGESPDSTATAQLLRRTVRRGCAF